ncbi:electron transport complex subunit RsxC [Idiomarina sp. M1R2S28]|uniref:Ion-translocating oxidoreductase complex subunit C n=2 Tax=Idiomarina TaxID=135575 RepID=A0A9X2FZR1_9GAMM|nr:electron transport complex subunit RsxC [Idiomarina rhizosphaerae]MCP1340524.1 electron transport complex subunit RsxC [Idiomarina rhizosphaerae]
MSDVQANKHNFSAKVIGHFPGGVHPPERKQPASSQPIRKLKLPQELILPVRQHIGPSGKVLVKVGERVDKGQRLTEAGLSQGLPLHAPTSGTIAAIEERPTAHASGLPEQAIVIHPDGEDRWGNKHALPDYHDVEISRLLELIQEAGIAGLGGAGFPTAQKLAQQKPLKHLIINGVECEPYIAADDRLMQEHADDIIAGIRILQYITRCDSVLLAIEDNKPEAIKAMAEAIDDNPQIQLKVVPTKYPSGGEKQLIELLTGHQVPSGKLPMDIGLLMQNVGTAYAVKRAIIHGEPLLERVVTLTGESLKQRGNVWALLGTPIQHLLDESGFTPEKKQRIIMGGPMMGFTLPITEVPVIKTTNCVLAPTEKELPSPGPELACIRCGACADACPATLQPQQLQWLAKAKDYESLEKHNLFDCIECGACAYVCPSEIPLVHYYRKAKAEVRNIAREKAKAEQARKRFEARQERLEREKEERLERHRKAAEERKKMQQEMQQEAQQKNSDEPGSKAEEGTEKPAGKSAAVAAAIARAKAKKAAQAAKESPEESNSAKGNES